MTAARTFRTIENAIRSLTDSTDVTVTLRGESVNFFSRNAANKRQAIEVDHGHGISGLVVVENGNHRLYISRHASSIGGMIEQAIIPAKFLRPLFKFPASAPDWINGLVSVSLENRFSGFKADGRPVFWAGGFVAFDGQIIKRWSDAAESGVIIDGTAVGVGDTVSIISGDSIPAGYDGTLCGQPESETCPHPTGDGCGDCPWADNIRLQRIENDTDGPLPEYRVGRACDDCTLSRADCGNICDRLEPADYVRAVAA